MATCERCGCVYANKWGQHHCKQDLPEMPAEFSETITVEGVGLRPKADYYDRKAWLEHVTDTAPRKNSLRWRDNAEAYRSEADKRAAQHQAEEALRHLS